MDPFVSFSGGDVARDQPEEFRDPSDKSLGSLYDDDPIDVSDVQNEEALQLNDQDEFATHHQHEDLVMSIDNISVYTDLQPQAVL